MPTKRKEEDYEKNEKAVGHAAGNDHGIWNVADDVRGG